MTASNLRISPRQRLRVQVVGKKYLLRYFAGNPRDAGRIKRLSRLKLLRFKKERFALLERQKVNKMRGLVVGRGEPVGGAAIARTHLGAGRGRLQTRTNRPPFGVD